MEQSSMDLLQFSFMENSQNVLESNIVSQLGTLEQPSTYHIADTISQDNKISESRSLDSCLDFFPMENTEYHLLEPFFSYDWADMSSLLCPSTSILEKSVSFNCGDIDHIPDKYEVSDSIATKLDAPTCSEINMCDNKNPSTIPTNREITQGQNTESEESNSVEKIDIQIRENDSAAHKYMEMRRKNNIASRRSRKIRKAKDAETAVKVKKLEAQNKELKLLADKLQKRRDALQDCLLKVLGAKK